MPLAGIDTNFTLPPRFYTSTEIFEEELERIFYSRWIYVACDADIPKPGDYVALKIGTRSFFLQRTEGGDVRGFYKYDGTVAMNWSREKKGIAGGSFVLTITGLTTLMESCCMPVV